MKEIIISGIIGLIVGVALAPFANVPWGDRMPTQNMMNSHVEMDGHFIEEMIPHHEDAITMAHTALEKAEHKEIKDLAADIERTQTAEIELMQRLYKEWYGQEITFINSAYAHGMTMNMGMMGDETDIEALENAKPFDKEFIKQMIPHHQMAVMMANMLLQTTDKPEMKKLARDIISAQTKEIDKMREWYRMWYLEN